MRILIATGGAPHSHATLRLGGYIAQATGAAVTVLTVVKNAAMHAQAEAILAWAKSQLPAGVEVQTIVRAGQPAEQIVLVCRETDQDLLILGERVHSRLPKRILAPTVERVLERMPCPVLLARGQLRPPKRILVCEGGRDPSVLNRLMGRLMQLLESAETITVLHVMSEMAAGPGVEDWELRADAEALMKEHTPVGKLLEGDLALMPQLRVHLEVKVRHGLVVAEILEEARSGDYDLLIIGAHRGSRWERFLLDDLAQEIIDHADRPVLVV